MNWARGAFDQTVGQYQGHIQHQFDWLIDKIKQLMNVHGAQYQGLEQSPYKQGKEAPGVPRKSGMICMINYSNHLGSEM